MKQVDVIVLGTGFCGSFVASKLSESNLEYLIVEPSQGESVIDYTVTKTSVFSTGLANKTVGLGGGSHTWGYAITHPSERNWFLPRGNRLWESLYSQVATVKIPKVLGIPKRSLRNTRFANKYFKNVLTSFHEEVGTYAGKKLGPQNSFHLPNLEPELLKNWVILEIQIINDSYVIDYLDLDFNHHQIMCTKLILASGTFLNSCFFSILSGVTRFPISNHFGANFGTIDLVKPIRIRDGIQTYAAGESSFSTFSPSRHFENGRYLPNSSIRLQADPIFISKKEALKKIARLNFRSISRLVIPYFIARVSGHFLVNHLQIRVMLDHPINQTNCINIELLGSGRYQVQVELKIDEQVVQDSFEIVKDFLQLIHPAGIVDKVETLKPSEIEWSDAAHYFGSTPIGVFDLKSALNEYSESVMYDGLYILGSSSFPQGSHGHPTLLCMKLASLSVDHLISNFKGDI